MSIPPVSGAIAPPRYTLNDMIKHISSDPDKRAELIEELEQDVEASVEWASQAKNNQILCSLCQEDDTITDPKVKNKFWNVQIELNDHMKMDFHTPRAKWVRRTNQYFEASGEAKVECPYCERAGTTKSFTEVWSLVRHIENDTSAKHRQYAQEDGWFGDNWASHPEQKSRLYRQTGDNEFRTRVIGARMLQSNEKEPPVPIIHEGIPGAARGAGLSPRVNIPGTVRSASRSDSLDFDVLSERIITITSQPPEHITPVIPPYLRPHVILTNAYIGPATEKKRQGDEIDAAAVKRHRGD
ncbi:hypothetical protein FPOAC2_12692 [Fusarium poae]|uniref:hypothetical protein n=1 Tax=Fusarium poae TaxID=36050 RepID=UPI001CE8D0CE|nr:hypothetical protein FPOAC1_012357 [Fusarium poae]KAG8667524.1 hypothetical protein FPOAC1_012357 [Fusarium poae]